MRAFVLLLLAGFSFVACVSDALTCSDLLAPASDFDLVEAAETKLTESYSLSLDSGSINAVIQLNAQVNDLINLVLEGESLSGFQRSALRQLVESVDFINSPFDSWVNTLTPAQTQSVINDLEQIESFDQIIPNKKYNLKSNNSSDFTISFNTQVLGELTSNKLPDDYKKAFLRAIKKGVVPGNGNIGVKLMKTFEGIFFAEVKLIGKLGDKRIYGFVENSHITLGFVGSDSESNTDAVHNRIRAIGNN